MSKPKQYEMLHVYHVKVAIPILNNKNLNKILPKIIKHYKNGFQFLVFFTFIFNILCKLFCF